MKPEVLGKYLFASFMIARGSQNSNVSRDALENVVMPLLEENQNKCALSDVYSQFLQAIYSDYDLDRATQLVPKIQEVTSADILLKNYAGEIKKQALILVL